MLDENKIQSKRRQAAERREETSGSLDMRQMLVKSRDLEFQPRFSHSMSAQSTCPKCKMGNALKIVLKYAWLYPPK